MSAFHRVSAMTNKQKEESRQVEHVARSGLIQSLVNKKMIPALAMKAYRRNYAGQRHRAILIRKRKREKINGGDADANDDEDMELKLEEGVGNNHSPKKRRIAQKLGLDDDTDGLTEQQIETVFHFHATLQTTWKNFSAVATESDSSFFFRRSVLKDFREWLYQSLEDIHRVCEGEWGSRESRAMVDRLVMCLEKSVESLVRIDLRRNNQIGPWVMELGHELGQLKRGNAKVSLFIQQLQGSLMENAIHGDSERFDRNQRVVLAVLIVMIGHHPCICRHPQSTNGRKGEPFFETLATNMLCDDKKSMQWMLDLGVNCANGRWER
eukprot:TRINITY_DN1173_c0_g1_i3.p1 TRINITY_DN1173_c0_g1~~TRINITY_DN1173_c0_g1_i3.p1  ORF type:complete len:324 (-),score=82.25 TRINITY_DN1173_c0_g1_i3:1104-2075(-)